MEYNSLRTNNINARASQEVRIFVILSRKNYRTDFDETLL